MAGLTERWEKEKKKLAKQITEIKEKYSGMFSNKHQKKMLKESEKGEEGYNRGR